METLFSAFSSFVFFYTYCRILWEEWRLNISSPLFTGCATALVTPFTSGGSIDQNALHRLIENQLEAQADALVLLGTTAEPCTLTMAEREHIIHIGVQVVNGRIPIIVGTGANDTLHAEEYAKQAEALGADGQLCVTPYYNKTTQTGLVRHFSKIADSSNLPIILYNVPSRTGISITAQTAAELALHPKIIGLKEASGDLALAADILFMTKHRLPLYCGNDDLILPLMALGAQGAISVCANVLPKQTGDLTHACLNGDFDHAKALQFTLLPLIRCLFSQVNPIPAKAALFMMNLCEDTLRLPLIPLEEPYRTKLHDVLSSMHII